MYNRIWILPCLLGHFAFFAQNGWNRTAGNGFDMLTLSGRSGQTTAWITDGMKTISDFFGVQFDRSFEVYIHPDRRSLDSTWQKDWNSPDFKSECWMVASGVAKRIDLIDPEQWKKTSCEHDGSDIPRSKQLICHELVHVYHGQKNPSPDFSQTQGIDWLVEGLAVYASGQCDEQRLGEVKKMIGEKTAPGNLDAFWKGKNKYGLSGSMVMYVDKKWGREKLKEILKCLKKEEVLKALKTNESELIKGWSQFYSNP